MEEKKKSKQGAHLAQYNFKLRPDFISPGRPKGSKNRSTIARKYLEAKDGEGVPYEDLITIAQLKKAQEDGDTTAYKAIMDSAYGPAQTNQTVEGDEHLGLRPLFGDKMEEDDITTDESAEEDTEGNSEETAVPR